MQKQKTKQILLLVFICNPNKVGVTWKNSWLYHFFWSWQRPKCVDLLFTSKLMFTEVKKKSPNILKENGNHSKPRLIHNSSCQYFIFYKPVYQCFLKGSQCSQLPQDRLYSTVTGGIWGVRKTELWTKSAILNFF